MRWSSWIQSKSTRFLKCPKQQNYPQLIKVHNDEKRQLPSLESDDTNLGEENFSFQSVHLKSFI